VIVAKIEILWFFVKFFQLIWALRSSSFGHCDH